MDPVSAVIGIASGAAGLVAIAAQLITYLTGLRESYQAARLMVLDLAATCQSFRAACVRVNEWATSACDVGSSTPSSSLLDQLMSFIELSKIILDTISSDIYELDGFNSQYVKRGLWFPSRKESRQLMQYQQRLHGHSEKLHHQISSLNLLLTTLTLYVIRLETSISNIDSYLGRPFPFKKPSSRSSVLRSARMRRARGPSFVAARAEAALGILQYYSPEHPAYSRPNPMPR